MKNSICLRSIAAFYYYYYDRTVLPDPTQVC